MSKERAQDKDFGESYLYLARTLRNWLVAYGLGVPALFLASDSLTARLLDSPRTEQIVGLFLIGVAIQITTTLLYKVAMWYCHYGELLPDFKKTLRHRVSDAISDWMWLELLLDVMSIAAFGWATWLLFGELSSRA